MTPGIHRTTSRLFAAHAAVAIMSLAGAIGLQWLWNSALAFGKESWWLHSSDLLLLTTFWLLFTAWLHFSLTKHGATTGQTTLQAGADLAACACTAYILAQGHTSPLASTGLWPLMPLLISVAAPSAFILFATTFASHQPPSIRAVTTVGVLRLITFSALIGYLIVLTTA